MSEDKKENLATRILSKMKNINKPSSKSYIKFKQRIICTDKKGNEETHKQEFKYNPSSNNNSEDNSEKK